VPVGSGWFETVAEAQRRARKRLPSSVYGALLAGSEKGVTVGDNVAAFSELGFAPHVAGLPAKRDLATTVMGQPVSLPVIISPTGVQAVHPDGEVAVARAAAARGTAMGLSSFASMPVEEVVAANPQTFFQTYWVGTREQMQRHIERARGAGAVGLIATLDWSFSNGRDWGSPLIPERLDVRTMLRMAPQGLARPRWLAGWARAGHLPRLTVPNMAGPDTAGTDVAGPNTRGTDTAPTFFGAYGQWMASPLATWDDIRWLGQEWGGPFMLKGVIRVDDAKRAVDAGVTAISVSNHGGNNLDGTPATIRALPAIAEAVGNQVEVLLDGGVRRGGDVVKALALGARAVMIGRAYLWGLAANGQAGVENVLDILRGGIDSALLGLGRASVHELTASDVVVPPGFTRTLGAG
jgi:L-lactate dehydrogenase (cytochrome)/glycolate oxidase